ncbi:hypothetical protein N7466_010246 [Penicillium verhagenii]|uniref:uncharacterized protein n=1 Tax=Penicillium verhagenii TaxID=1562060 RepID=UPI0025458CC0|nr:uncharacterized protein N7466_010246 [Penicillium verhagenii]KAJ5919303.1 hypothetical protein N7466_010246 [Penicillium verhagenii]
MSEFITEAFTLLAVAIVLIALRTTARWVMVGPKNFQADDYIMLVACVVYGLETAAAYMVGAWFEGLANNSMTDEERKTLSPDSHEYHLRVGGSKVQVAGWSLYTLLLWLLKTCMAVFYSRLTAGLINMRIRIHIAYVLIAATYIVTICSILFGCHPLDKNWQIYPNPGNHCQPAVSKIDIYVTVVLNVATDIYLISIPAPMLFKARLRWREKFELLILFSGGLFVMISTPNSLGSALTNNRVLFKAGANGAEQAGSWACRETFVAVVIGNIPMIYPLIRRFARRAGLYLTTKTGGGSQSYQLSEGEADTGGGGDGYVKRKKFRHPLSLPGESQWNTVSDEQMILPNRRQQPATCTAGDGDWDTTSHESHGGGIKVVHETIVHSAEKEGRL